MEPILEISKYVIPSLIIFLLAFLLVRGFLRNDEQRRKMEISLQNKKTILPIRLQAYERLALFLERISPDSILMRLNNPELSAGELQRELLATIRAEYEHNLSQQVYISHDAWEMIKNARISQINLINTAASELGPKARGLDLSRKILEKEMENERPPIKAALDYLKREIQQLY